METNSLVDRFNKNYRPINNQTREPLYPPSDGFFQNQGFQQSPAFYQQSQLNQGFSSVPNAIRDSPQFQYQTFTSSPFLPQPVVRPQPPNSGRFQPPNSGRFQPPNSGRFQPPNSGRFQPPNSGRFQPPNSGRFQPPNSGRSRSQNSRSRRSQNSRRSRYQNSGRFQPQNSGRSHSPNSGRSHSPNSERSHSQNSGRSHYQNSERSHSQNSGRSHSQNSGRSHSQNSGRSHSQNSGRSHSQNSERSHSQNSERSHSQNSERSHSQNSERSHSQNSERSHSQNSERSHYQNSERSHYQNSERSHSQNSGRSHSQNSGSFHAPNSTWSQAPNSTWSQAPNSTWSQPPSSTWSQPPNSTWSQPPNSTWSEAPNSTWSEAPNSTWSQPPNSTCSEAPNSTWSQPPNSTWSQPPNSTWSQPPNSTWSEAPNSTWSEAPNSTWSEAPNSTWSEAPNSTWSQPPNSTWSQPPNSTWSEAPNSTWSEAPNSTRSEAPNSTWSQPPNSTWSQPPNSTWSQPPNSTWSEAPNSTWSEAPNSTWSEAPNSTWSEAPNSTWSQPPNSTWSQPPNSTWSQPPNSTWSEAPNSTRSEAPNSTWSEAPNSTRSEAPNSTWSQPPNLTWSQPPNSTWSQPPNSTWSQPPNSTWSEAPNSTWSEAPNSTWSEAPNSTWSEAPNSTWSEAPNSFRYHPHNFFRRQPSNLFRSLPRARLRYQPRLHVEPPQIPVRSSVTPASRNLKQHKIKKQPNSPKTQRLRSTRKFPMAELNSLRKKLLNEINSSTSECVQEEQLECEELTKEQQNSSYHKISFGHVLFGSLTLEPQWFFLLEEVGLPVMFSRDSLDEVLPKENLDCLILIENISSALIRLTKSKVYKEKLIDAVERLGKILSDKSDNVVDCLLKKAQPLNIVQQTWNKIFPELDLSKENKILTLFLMKLYERHKELFNEEDSWQKIKNLIDNDVDPSLSRKGEEELKKGNFKEALQYFDEAIKNCPLDIANYKQRAKIHEKLQNYKLCSCDLIRLHVLDPDWEEGFFLHKEILKNLDDQWICPCLKLMEKWKMDSPPMNESFSTENKNQEEKNDKSSTKLENNIEKKVNYCEDQLDKLIQKAKNLYEENNFQEILKLFKVNILESTLYQLAILSLINLKQQDKARQLAITAAETFTDPRQFSGKEEIQDLKKMFSFVKTLPSIPFGQCEMCKNGQQSNIADIYVYDDERVLNNLIHKGCVLLMCENRCRILFHFKCLSGTDDFLWTEQYLKGYLRTSCSTQDCQSLIIMVQAFFVENFKSIKVNDDVLEFKDVNLNGLPETSDINSSTQNQDEANNVRIIGAMGFSDEADMSEGSSQDSSPFSNISPTSLAENGTEVKSSNSMISKNKAKMRKKQQSKQTVSSSENEEFSTDNPDRNPNVRMANNVQGNLERSIRESVEEIEKENLLLYFCSVLHVRGPQSVKGEVFQNEIKSLASHHKEIIFKNGGLMSFLLQSSNVRLKDPDILFLEEDTMATVLPETNSTTGGALVRKKAAVPINNTSRSSTNQSKCSSVDFFGKKKTENILDQSSSEDLSTNESSEPDIEEEEEEKNSFFSFRHRLSQDSVEMTESESPQCEQCGELKARLIYLEGKQNDMSAECENEKQKCACANQKISLLQTQLKLAKKENESLKQLIGEITSENNNKSTKFNTADNCAWPALPKVESLPPQKKKTHSIDCLICYEDLSSLSVNTLQCGHAFHDSCIRKWLKQQKTCPSCRKHVLLNDEFPPLS